MAYAWNRGDKSGLWVISREPYAELRLLPGEVYPVGWSPDGKYVYAIRADSLGAGREVIKVQVAAPNEITAVGTLPGEVVEGDGASVSPDGKQIVVSISDERSDVWLMENLDPAQR